MSKKSVIKVLALVEASWLNGPAKNLLDFARVAREGDTTVEVTIATYLRGAQDSKQNEFITAAQALGMRVEIMTEGFRFDPRVLPQLHRLAARCAPDIIQTHSVKSHFLLFVSRLWRRYAWVAFHHGYTATDQKVRAYNQLDRWSLRHPQQVVTMNQAFVQQLADKGVPRRAIKVVHNAINTDWVKDVSEAEKKSLRDQLQIHADEKMILSVGRLSHEKAQIDLVEAVGLLRRAHLEYKTKLVLVGAGPEQQRIANRAAAHGITTDVLFTGQKSDVKNYFAAADIFVLPSHTEGSPNVLLEAMAAGLPVIATKVGGVPEIATHNFDAMLVTPHQPEEITAALAHIFENEAFAKGLATNAQNTVREKFSITTRREKLLEIYRQLYVDAPTGSTRLELAVSGAIKK